jgi:hypothetical protein
MVTGESGECIMAALVNKPHKLERRETWIKATTFDIGSRIIDQTRFCFALLEG